MSLRTKESLKKLFEASRARNEKKKRLQEQKYRNAQESTRKALADKLTTKQEKVAQKAQKQPQIESTRFISVYNTKYIERFADENELYTTREQLEEAMPNNINWSLWDKLIEETKKSI